MFPKRVPHGERCPSPEPSFTYPIREGPPPGSPNRAPVERERCSNFRSPPSITSQSSQQKDPLNFPKRSPYGERHSFPKPSSTHPVIFHFPSKSPVREPHHVPLTGSLGTDILCLQSQMDYSFIYVCQSPQKEPSHEKGENVVTVHGAPCRWKAYIQ